MDTNQSYKKTDQQSFSFSTKLAQTEIIWKTSFGSALAWEAAKLAGSAHPFLAPLTLILCLQGSVHQSLNFAFGRVIGTVFGLFIIELFVHYFNLSPLSLLALILIGTSAAKLFKANNTIIHQVALSILLVFAFQNKAPDYTIDRLRDTVIGAALAYVFILLIFPHNDSQKIKLAFRKQGEELATLLMTISDWIGTGVQEAKGTSLKREVLKKLRKTQHARHKFEQSLIDLKWNIYNRKTLMKMKHLTTEWERLIQGYMHALEMIDVLVEWKKDMMPEPEEKKWMKITKELSGYIKNWVHTVGNKSLTSNQKTIDSDLPANLSILKQQTILQQETEWLMQKFSVPSKD